MSLVVLEASRAAADLELALRRGATLAALDGPLRAVARRLGVPVLSQKLPDG